MYIVELNGPVKMSGAADRVEVVIKRQVDGGTAEEPVDCCNAPNDGEGLPKYLESHQLPDGTPISEILKEPVLLRIEGWDPSKIE